MIFNILLVINNLENEDDRNLILNIYEKYGCKIKLIAWNVLKNEADAEDAVSETILKVIKYCDRFVDIGPNETNRLIVIYTRSVCFNMKKRNHTVDVFSITDFAADDEGNSQDMDPPNDVDVLSEIINAETVNKLYAAIKALDVHVQDMIKMKYYYHIKNTEIADILGIETSNVGVILLRARNKLKILLEGYINSEYKG